MPNSTDWLLGVLNDGACLFDDPQAPFDPKCPGVRDLLRQAFARHAATVGGPAVPYDEDAALWATTLLFEAGWLLVDGGEVPSWPREPTSAASHLSADLMLRYLTTVHARAKSRDDAEPLARALEGVFRRWPLTGVLAGLDGSPTTAVDFDHAGLQMLCAERLVVHGQPGWYPPDGRGREWAERIHDERGTPMPATPEASLAR